MPRANEKEKSFTLLEKDLNIIFAVSNPKLSQYLDVFRHYPENIMLQNLGILSGFFKINDLSDESAYIVNFLSSVLKKEYYANPKRSIENSFDSALQKVNLALSEIAKEGNINWLGKIDGVVSILEKNNLHFSVCGKARVFLLRKQMLSEISVDMAPSNTQPNPLKTFADVSSGRLENEDKLIICEDDIFKVFSEEELRKGAIRFKREKFIQFIKTALTNKLEIVGAIVVDIFEKSEEEKKSIHEDHKEVYNVFSKKVFEEKKSIPKGLENLLSQEEKSGYTDEKTGHIYIQEGKEEIKKDSGLGIYWFLLEERIGDAFFWIKNRSRRKISLLKRSISKTISETSRDLMTSVKSKIEEIKRERLIKKEWNEKLAATATKALEDEKNKEALAISAVKEEPVLIGTSGNEEKIEIETPVQPVFNEPFLTRLQKRKEELEKQEKEEYNTDKKNISAFLKKIIPDFGKIKILFESFSKKQKLYSLAIILLIFIVPFVFLKTQTVMKKNQTPKQEAVKIPNVREIFAKEKNIVFLDNLEKVFAIQNPKSIMILNNKLIAMSDSKTITKDPNGNMKDIPWNKNYGNIKEIAPMKDLNLALAYTDQNKIISFLSSTSQFTDNTASIPEDAKITGIGTYLTYAYLLDSKNNQIYRYPRATGGFGDKINWLKDNIILANSCCMAVDENVYLINNGKIMKLFKGQNQNLKLEETAIPFTPSKIFTNSDTQNLYVLDKGNGRVIKFGKDGTILGQYLYEEIKNAIDIAVDEKNNKFYLTNSEGLVSFNLQ